MAHSGGDADEAKPLQEAEVLIARLREELINPRAYGSVQEKWQAECSELRHVERLVLECLSLLLLSGEAHQAVANLMLDGLPARRSGGAAQAVEVFLMACRQDAHRLAVKVSNAYDLQASDFTAANWDELCKLTGKFLDNRGSAASAVALLLRFPELNCDPDLYLETLVMDGQETVAGRWVATLSKQARMQLVQLCIQHDRLRSACRLVEDFGLELEFPNVQALYRSKTLERMVRKGLWSVATAFVEGDEALQATLVQAMVVAGEAALAQEHCAIFGLDPADVLEVDEDALEAAHLRRQEQYLQLSIPDEAVCFIDTLPGIEAMRSTLGSLLRRLSYSSNAGSEPGTSLTGSVDAVAVDVEWKPAGRDEASRPASILQLAVANSIFVVDLLALAAHHPEALSAVLQPLFLAPSVYKLGVGVSGDLRKLAASYPAVHAFRKANACLDLATLWKGRDGAPSGRKRGAEIGLSRLADAVLGKAIDKAMQVSDWERRPLSPPQLRYAAVDAHAALQIFRGLGTLCPAYASVEGLKSHAFTWDAHSSAQGRPAAMLESSSPPPPGNGPPNGGNRGTGGSGSGNSGSGSSRSVLAGALPTWTEPAGGTPPNAGTIRRSWLTNSCRTLRRLPHRALLHGLRC